MSESESGPNEAVTIENLEEFVRAMVSTAQRMNARVYAQAFEGCLKFDKWSYRIEVFSPDETERRRKARNEEDDDDDCEV